MTGVERRGREVFLSRCLSDCICQMKTNEVNSDPFSVGRSMLANFRHRIANAHLTV